MPFCPECEYEYPPRMIYCSDCGTRLVKVLKQPEQFLCGSCKEELPGEVPVCPHCGTVFTTAWKCFEHLQQPAVGVCMMCGKHLCKMCLQRSAVRCFCAEHLTDEELGSDAASQTTRQDWEVELIRVHLAQRGIVCTPYRPYHRSRIWQSNGSDTIKVLVPHSQRPAAQVALQTLLEGKTLSAAMIQYECDICSAIGRFEETRCPHCGTCFGRPMLS